MHKNSREAGMHKMKNFAEDILKNMFEILATNMVSNQLSLLKNYMSCMVASQYCLFKRMSYTKAAYLQYLVLTMTIYTQIVLVVCVVQVYFNKKFGRLWWLKKGFSALLTLGISALLPWGKTALLPWGKNALLPCGGKCLVSEGKNALLDSKTHCQILLNYSAWLHGGHQPGILEDFTAWLPRRGLQLGSPEEDFSLASQKRTTQPCYPKKSQPSSGTLTFFCWWSVSAEMSASTCRHVFLHIQKLVRT